MFAPYGCCIPVNVLAAARITRVLCVYWVYIQGVVCWGMYVWGGVQGMYVWGIR